MHEGFLSYENLPPAAEWCMLDSEEALRRYQNRMPCAGDHILRWDCAGVEDTLHRIRTLRLYAESKTTDAPPACVREMTELLRLELPVRLVKTLRDDALPANLKVLQSFGEGSATMPKKLALPQIEWLLAIPSTIKFERQNFPNLKHLSIKLDAKKVMLQVCSTLESLRGLEIGPNSDDSVFDALSAISLQYLRLNGGTLNALSGIEQLRTLTNLWLQDLPKLTDLAPLVHLPSLEQLTVAWCKHLQNIEAVLEIPRLRKLQFFACGDIGLRRLMPKLQSMQLEELSISGTT